MCPITSNNWCWLEAGHDAAAVGGHALARVQILAIEHMVA
jgi:hypothetical protein